jgi:hypothetical protein
MSALLGFMQILGCFAWWALNIASISTFLGSLSQLHITPFDVLYRDSDPEENFCLDYKAFL